MSDERELTALQAAMIEHDDDMARLDRNTLTPTHPDQFEFWLNNYWPDWRKGNQDFVELMRAAWMAAMRLANFNELALKGAVDYTLELETTTNAAATRMREKCVEKVKQMRDDWYERMEQADEDSAVYMVMSSRSYGADKIITALESLTLDNGERES